MTCRQMAPRAFLEVRVAVTAGEVTGLDEGKVISFLQ
jgi:hypothetical protein